MSYSVTIIGFVGADSVKRGTTTARSSPFFPSRRSGRGRTPTTNGPQRPSGIASWLYGIWIKYKHAEIPSSFLQCLKWHDVDAN